MKNGKGAKKKKKKKEKGREMKDSAVFLEVLVDGNVGLKNW